MSSIVLTLGLIACSHEEINSEEETDPIVEMEKYETKVISARNLITEFCIETEKKELGTRTNITNSQSYLNLKNKLLPTAKEFALELNLSNDNIEDFLDSKIMTLEEQEDALIGILLFAVVTNYSNNLYEKTRASFKDCFLEATGIAAGAAIIGGLGKNVMTKSALKSTIKLAAKVGGRTLSGIGLALIAAEVAWCMW